MYTIITYIVDGKVKNEKGISLKKHEKKDEEFENDYEYELDGFVVSDSDPIEVFDEANEELTLGQRACRFAGNYMKSMLAIFGNEYDSEEEEDEDYEANDDSSDEESELDISHSESEHSENIDEEDGDEENDEEDDNEENNDEEDNEDIDDEEDEDQE